MKARALLVAVALVAVGCPDVGDGTCADDTVCGAGLVCAFGLCVDANDLASVDLEVEPVATSNLPAQSVFDVDASAADGRVDVALVGAARVSGSVVDVDGPAAASLRAVPARHILGRLRAPAAETDEAGAFSLPVLDDASYALLVEPTDYPPLVIDDVDAGDDFDDGLVVDDIDFIGVAGVVVNAGGPQQDLDVFVQVDRRRVSTLAVTDAAGAFNVVVRALPPGATLVVRPRVGSQAQPTVQVPLDGAGAAPGSVLDLGEISLGAGSGQNALVRGQVLRAGAPVAGAVVALDGLVGAGRFANRQVTNDDGIFVATVVSGTYEVAVVPPSTEQAGLSVTTVDLSASRDDLVINLPTRVRADLVIQNADGQAVAGAAVSLQRIGDIAGLAEPVLVGAQPAFLGAADVDGAARVFVDEGRYRVSVTPPLGSGVPAFSTLVTVAGSFERTFTLPPLRVFAGVVHDDDGAPTPGAFVRVFSRLVDEQGQALFLGEAVCGDDGSFAVSVADVGR
jgi:hypothetical protein